MTVVAEKRRPAPLAVKLQVALRQLAIALGLAPDTRFELDHTPALWQRSVDPASGQHIPHQHDPDSLFWRADAAHQAKTFGPGAEKRITSAGGDIHARAHTLRLAADAEEHRRRMLAKEPGRPPEKRGSIPGRSFRPAVPQRTASRPIERNRP